MFNRKREWRRALYFTFFSISAGLLELVLFTLLDEVAGLPYWPAYLIALIASVLYNFTINRKFTFHSAANIPVAMLKVFGFYCVFTPLSTWAGHWLTDLRGWNDYLVLGLTMAVNFVTEFLFTRFFVYGRQVDNDGSVQKEDSKG